MTRRVKSATRRTPNRLGTVEALPSGRYRAFYRREGRKFTAPRTFATHSEADAWLASEFADRARGVWRDPEAGTVTLAQYAADWLETRPDLAPRTRAGYRYNLDRWIIPRVGAGGGSRGVELGAMHVADIAPATVRAWAAAVFKAARASAAVQLTRERERSAHPARVWARSVGMQVADTGKLPATVLTAWQEAGEPQPARPARPTVVPLEQAGETTAAQAYRVLRVILSAAVTDGLLTANPCQIKGGGQVAHAERPTATPAEVAEIAAHMPARYAAAVLVAGWGGLRYGELFALARRHVDLRTGAVRVERALVQVSGQPIQFGKVKTAKSNRTVHLPAFVLPQLAAHMAEFVATGPDALLFPNTRGMPTSNATISKHFQAAREIVGRPDLRFHDLRHTGATLAYRAGASVPEVQARLGHTTARAASIYAHVAADSDAAVARNLDALYAGESLGVPRLRAV